MAFDAGSYYDAYWLARQGARTEVRSRERALATLDLLAAAGVRDGSLLDVGCGPGWTLEIFRAAGYAAIGIETSPRAVAAGVSKGLDVRQVDVERDELEAALGSGTRLRAIVALEVLEHLVDPLALLQKLRRLLAADGVLIVSLPNELALGARWQLLCGRLPFGGHDDPHLRHFDRAQARRLFEAAGLRVLASTLLHVAPPRWRVLRWATRWLLRLLPGLFSLASVHSLVPKERP